MYIDLKLQYFALRIYTSESVSWESMGDKGDY
jgi:hypothetical protein